MLKGFIKQLRPALVSLLILTVICGVLYTALITGLGQVIFPSQANGSLITNTASNGSQQNYGSALLGQNFNTPQYLIGRPMAVSNLSPTSTAQAALVQQRIDWWHQLDPSNSAPIPLELVTASGSGYDPNISPEAAEYQVERIARARNIGTDEVRSIIQQCTSGRFLGFIGEPVVNVLQVNLALDGLN